MPDCLKEFQRITDQCTSPADVERIKEIIKSVPGYSGAIHYLFFKGCLLGLGVKSILMLGVYHGRDIKFIQAISEFYNHPVKIVGVDKFDDSPCADWTDEQKGLSWEKAGYGSPPNFEQAQRNVGHVLVKMHDVDYLSVCKEKFDLVYLDTAHDHRTVSRQLWQVKKLGAKFVAGDDYSDGGTWGVKSAVDEGTEWRAVFGNLLWVTSEIKDGSRSPASFP